MASRKRRVWANHQRRQIAQGIAEYIAGGEAEHQGRLPQPGVPAGSRNTANVVPPSKSGGNSGDLSIPHYTPKTPIGAPYDPAEPGHAERDFEAAFRGKTPPQVHPHTVVSDLLDAVQAVTSPFGNRSVPQTAKAALNLGVEPSATAQAKAELPKGVTPTDALAAHFGAAVAHLVQGTQAPEIPASRQPHSVDVAQKTQAPKRPAADPLGKKTLGKVTAAQLAHAAREGTLRIGKHGVLTTPGGRGDLSAVAKARQQVAKSGPNLQALHAAYPELSIPVLKSYADAARRTGVPPQLLAGIEEQESSYGQSTLPGVHSGQNFAGAAGPFQIGNGTGASGDAWQTVAEELWGDKAGQHSPYNQHDAALVAGQYLTHTYGSATKDPATWKAAAESYNHAGWYGEKAVQVADEHAKLAKLGLPPNPTAQETLKVAVANARADGINPTPWNGDVIGGGGKYVYVRADAQGMVNWLESALGTQEGSARQQHWATKLALGLSEPWCANLASNGLLRRGFKASELPANPNYTGSYEEWGKEGKYATDLGTDLAKAKPGDVLAFSAAHTATYVGNGEMISGNFGNEVMRTPVSDGPAPLSMIIRPHYKGGRVKVKAGSLPGSSSTATFGSGGETGTTGTPTGVGGESAGGTSSAIGEGHAVSIGEVPIASILGPEHNLLEEEPAEGVIQQLVNARRVR